MLDYRIHHIGYFVNDIVLSSEEFFFLGYEYFESEDIVFDIERNIDILFLCKDGCLIELVSPRPGSVYGELHRKIGNSPYHICYEVNNLKQAVEELRNRKYVKCGEPSYAIALNGMVCFLISSRYGMIELFQKNEQCKTN